MFVLMRDFLRKRRTSAVPSLADGGLAGVVAMLAAGMFEYNFGDSEFLMLFLLLVTLPYAADGSRAPAPAIAAASPPDHGAQTVLGCLRGRTVLISAT